MEKQISQSGQRIVIRNAEMEACIDNCMECFRVCDETASKSSNKDHFVMLNLCADICNTSAKFML